MNRFDNFQQFALTQQQQNNVTGGNAFRPQTMPAVLISSVNTWSSTIAETTATSSCNTTTVTR